MVELMELTEEQKQAFLIAKTRARELMTSLYVIRNTFYVGGTIPKNGNGVWRDIPRAQGLVNQIEELIESAEGSTRIPK